MILPNSKIFIINKPVNGRFGIPGLWALLSSNKLDLLWDGGEPITVIFFTQNLRLCKVLSVDDYGITCSTRKLRTGRFKYILHHNIMPTKIKKSELIELFNSGRVTRVAKLRFQYQPMIRYNKGSLQLPFLLDLFEYAKKTTKL